MNRHRFVWLAALIVLLLGSSGAPGGMRVVLAQGPSLEGVIKAVVRISGQRCEPVCREAGVGSGAIIDPSGVILTAYHVTLDPEKSPEGYLDDFIIEMSEDVRQPAMARYRARIIAAQPSLDLALLRVDRSADASQTFAPFELTGLPVLSLGSAAELRLQEQLLIAGYPFLAAGRSIKVDNKNLTGFASERLSGRDVSDAFLTIQGRLSEGYSGGPVLAERNGVYEIVGTVIGGVGLREEIGYLRSIDLLRDLKWLEPQARANAESVKLELVQDASGEQELRISLNLDALDLAGRRARLVFYAFADDLLGMPVYAPSGPNRTRGGQLAFAVDLETQQFVDRIEATHLRIPVGAPSIAAEPMKFRALLWDDEVLWQSNEWYRLQVRPAAQAAAPAPAEAPTATQVLPAATPVPATETRVPPSATHVLPTATPVPTDTPTLRPTATPSPTKRPTYTMTPEPMFSVQQAVVNVRSGPGTAYPVIGQLRAEDRARITGRNEAGDWWQFDYSGREGWVAGSVVEAEGSTGSVQLARYNPPPTPPPPTSTPIPTFTLTAIPVPTSTPVPPPTATAALLASSGALDFPFVGERGGAEIDFDTGTVWTDGYHEQHDLSIGSVPTTTGELTCWLSYHGAGPTIRLAGFRLVGGATDLEGCLAAGSGRDPWVFVPSAMANGLGRFDVGMLANGQWFCTGTQDGAVVLLFLRLHFGTENNTGCGDSGHIEYTIWR